MFNRNPLGISCEGERFPHADFTMGFSLCRLGGFIALTKRKLFGLKMTYSRSHFSYSFKLFALKNVYFFNVGRVICNASWDWVACPAIIMFPW